MICLSPNRLLDAMATRLVLFLAFVALSSAGKSAEYDTREVTIDEYEYGDDESEMNQAYHPTFDYSGSDNCREVFHSGPDQKIGQLIPLTPGCRWGTLTLLCLCGDGCQSTSVVCDMHSSDDSDWLVHCLVLSFHYLRDLPLRRPPPTVPCSRPNL